MSAAWSISVSSSPPRLSSASSSLGPVASALASSSFFRPAAPSPSTAGRAVGRQADQRPARARPPRRPWRGCAGPGRSSRPAPRSRRSTAGGTGRGIWNVRPMPRLMIWCGGRPGDLVALEADRPRRRRERPRQHVEDRALARAVRADQAENLALIDLERDVADGGEAAETLDQALDDEHGPSLSRTPPRRLLVAVGHAGRQRQHRLAPAAGSWATRRTACRRRTG